ncbi:MAG: hypothetical protein ACOYOS_08230 [Syntrophales bacterium]
MTTYASNQLHMVPLAELQPDPAQPRKYLDPLALEELTASVSQAKIIGKSQAALSLSTGKPSEVIFRGVNE